ncbi:MAG: MEKHLA domain-containing protein [Asticcacaulis sp.]
MHNMAMPPFLTSSVCAYNRLMADSFQGFTGMSVLGALDSRTMDDDALAQALFLAPQAIVSHGTQDDPIFRYANRRALQLWEMSWETFTRLPSRFSAEAADDIQSNREALLEAANEKGWVDTYSGVRISNTGKRFEISDTILWNVVDSNGQRHGQAAFIQDWRYL